jgi:hypothetical protein
MMQTRTLRESFEELAPVVRELLPRMVDPTTGLFCHKSVLAGDEYRNVGTSPFYTAVSLVGALSDDTLASLASEERLEAVHDAAIASSDPSLIGAGAWALAAAGDERAHQLISRGRHLPVRRLSSMGLGLLLAGAAAVAEDQANRRDALRDAASSWRSELSSRFIREAGVFRGLVPSFSLDYLMHGRVSSFAAQVYPLHGLARATLVFGLPLPDACRRCADNLVALQGSLGQWWWFYSVEKPKVLDGYPVYSVHQDGMAFMALCLLQEIGVEDYASPLRRGLAWLMGANELGESLVSANPPFVSRCIQRRGSDADAFGGLSRADRLRLFAASLRLASPLGSDVSGRPLEILRECRPYHLGWLLYARALTQGWDE